jgi:hypothetical protein
MSTHEAVPGRRAEAPRALAANLIGGHLVVPTYLIAACADVRQASGTLPVCLLRAPQDLNSTGPSVLLFKIFKPGIRIFCIQPSAPSRHD